MNSQKDNQVKSLIPTRPTTRAVDSAVRLR